MLFRRRTRRERMAASARRLLREKFVLGLFDRPLVDAEAAERIVGAEEFRAAVVKTGDPLPVGDVKLLPPLDGRGEVWCAGVTYERSRGARMEESGDEVLAGSTSWRSARRAWTGR